MLIPFEFEAIQQDQMLNNSRSFMQSMQRRRTIREFSDKSVETEIIENAVRAAVSAPSGANKQPWHFVIIGNSQVKHQIRLAAEEEERAFYGGRAPQPWLQDLEVFETNAEKPFLEHAPFLIPIFLQRHSVDEDGAKHKNYYMPESVGIATGILLTALHQSGLVTLTHTPSPMKFLNEICGRPKTERPYMLIVTGYPAEGARVPDIQRKPFDQVASLIY